MSIMQIPVLDSRLDPLALGDRVHFVGPSGCSSKPASGDGEVIGSDAYGNLLIRPDSIIHLFKRDGTPNGNTFTMRFPCPYDNARKCRVAKGLSGNIYKDATHNIFVERLTPPPAPPSRVKVAIDYWKQ